MAISSTSDSDTASNFHAEVSLEGAMEPFDYDAIAELYDEHRRGRGPFLGALVRPSEASEATRVLEPGCGRYNQGD